jgi:hypothetical protein
MSIVDSIFNWNEDYKGKNPFGSAGNFNKAINNAGSYISDGLFSGVENVYDAYQENAPKLRSLMSMTPGGAFANSFSNKFNDWQDKEKELYTNYMSAAPYVTAPDGQLFRGNNNNQYSSAFGEAKGANLINAPFLGPTPFANSDNAHLQGVDYGVGAAQLAAGNTINSAYQLLQEGGKAVKNQGWKGLINTDWLKNAYADVVEEGNAFNKARFSGENLDTVDNLWNFGNKVDDKNTQLKITTPDDASKFTTDEVIKQALEAVQKQKAQDYIPPPTPTQRNVTKFSPTRSTVIKGGRGGRGNVGGNKTKAGSSRNYGVTGRRVTGGR